MKSILLPLVLLIVGLGGGVGAAMFLAPAADVAGTAGAATCDPSATDDHGAPIPCPEPAAATATEGAHAAAPPAAAHPPASGGDHGAAPAIGYARLSNQFLIPVVEGSVVRSTVILTLGLEMDGAQQELVLSYEPLLRDRMLQVLFDHANTGGFNGVFTASSNLRSLRQSLTLAAQEVLGPAVRGVLIIDLARQDL